MTARAMSAEGLAHLHETMTAHVEAGEIPGLVMLVARDDEIHIDAIGSASFADHSHLGRSAIFRIASLTKPITAVATMSLVEEGVLGLDQPVGTCCRSSLIVGCCGPSTASSMTRWRPIDPSRSRICSASASGSDRSWRRPTATPSNEPRPSSACRASGVRRGRPWRTTSTVGWRPSAPCRSCTNRFEGDVEKAFGDLAADNSEFATWFRAQVKEITGVDLGAPPDGPLPAVLINWHS